MRIFLIGRYRARCHRADARSAIAAPVKAVRAPGSAHLLQRLATVDAAQPSGQPAAAAYREPLRGSPVPLGASNIGAEVQASACLLLLAM